MLKNCRNVCVIGAGTMGSGIASHLANLGFEVTLLDLTEDSVRAAFDRARRARPPHFYVPEIAETIRLGSIKENLDWVSEADWVCEAVVERLDVKRDLFEKVEPLLAKDAYVSSNTSGLQISLLTEGRGDAFRSRFMGTHFFNPPRYLKLLELIPTPDTDPKAVAEMSDFLEERVARRVVVAKDTPGFIANRFGMWCMFHAVHVAEKLGLTVEQVDTITGPFIGRPRSGSFRLNDLVGLDIMLDIAKNLQARCSADPHMATLNLSHSMDFLMDRGWIGEKVGQGFYRKEGKELVSLDLRTLAYRQRQEAEFPSVRELGRLPLHERIPAALDLRDEVGEYLRNYLLPALQYADYLKAEISHNVQDFDRVMMWGFGWQAGPFETIDWIGADKVGVHPKRFYDSGQVLAFDRTYFTPKPEPEYQALTDFELKSKKDHFNIRDLGDGVDAICLTTKMGVITPGLVDELTAFLESGATKRFVLASEARSFSAGYDLNFFLAATQEARWDDIDAGLAALQKLSGLVGTIPSVAAVFGHCLGAGFEIAGGCSVVAAHPEAQIGLPESRVGLVPGGGGTAMMRVRSQVGAKQIVDAVRLLTLGTVSTCADEARKYGFLRRNDVTVYHPDRLLMEAKRLALEAKVNQDHSWDTVAGPVLGMSDKMLADLKAKGEISAHDSLIGDKVEVVMIKSSSWEDALAKERAVFIELLHEGYSIARIRHMLDTGKPLKN